MINISANKEPILRKGLIKEYFRTKHYTVLLTFPVEKYNDVINILAQYNQLFISIEIGNFSTLSARKDINVFNIGSDFTLDELKSAIAWGSHGDSFIKPSGHKYNDNLGVYAVMFEVCYTDKSTIKEIGFELMLQNLPKDFYIKGIKWIDNYLCQFEFSNKKSHKNLKAKNKPVALIICEGSGSSDFYMIYTYIVEFIKVQKELGNDVHIITVNGSGLYKLLTMFEQDYKVFVSQISHISARFYEIVMKSGTYSQCYCISMNPFKYPGKVLHITDMWALELGIRGDFDYFGSLDTDYLLSKSLPVESNIAFIDKVLQQKRPIVGIQFHTDSPGNETKNWPYESIKEFASIAIDNGITLLNLSPNPYGEIEGVTDVSFLNKHEIFYLISKLDTVISIDSFCGHMAALFGIPNITIWARQHPDIVNPYDQYPILRSFRPLRMNYSIATKTLNPADIKPELVFTRLKAILHGNIELSKNRISAEETSAGKCIETVD